MPKLIENPKEKILVAAKKQLEEVGYSAMTIQSVARACGVGVGTVYNYFSSKDEILASYIAQDWTECVKVINAVSRYSQTYDAVLHCIYDQVLSFGKAHESVFQDEGASSSIDGVMYRHMGFLSRQVAVSLKKFCKSEEEAQIIAEALLTWIRTGKSFEEIYEKIVKLF